MIAYGDPNLQDVITGVENVDTMMAYINVETGKGILGKGDVYKRQESR